MSTYTQNKAITANRNLSLRYCIPRKYVPLHFVRICHIENTRVILEDRQCMYKIRRLRVTTAHGKSAGITYSERERERERERESVCACACVRACACACVCVRERERDLRHPAYKQHAPHTVTCRVPGSTIFFHIISKHKTRARVCVRVCACVRERAREREREEPSSSSIKTARAANCHL